MEARKPLFQFNSRGAFSFLALLSVLLLLWLSTGYPPRARYVPQVVGLFTLACLLLQLLLDSCPRLAAMYQKLEKEAVFKANKDEQSEPSEGEPELRLEVVAFLWLGMLLTGLILFGFLAFIPFYILFYLRFQAGLTWINSSLYALGTLLFIYFLFVVLFEIRLYPGVLAETFLDF